MSQTSKEPGVCNIAGVYKHIDSQGKKGLYNEVQIEEAIELSKRLPMFESGTIYKVGDLFDEVQEFEVPEIPPGSKLDIKFNSYHHFAMNINDNGTIKNHDDKTSIVPYTIGPFKKSNHITKVNQGFGCSVPPFEKTKIPAPQYESWKSAWESETGALKKFSNELRRLITKHASHLSHIDKVICFALGPLNYKRSRPYIQHLAACTIRDALQSITQLPQKNIQIIAQDPAYHDCCTAYMSDLDIHFIRDFRGFQLVDENSFVMCISPSAPICQILADIVPNGGPAAMFIEEIDDDIYKYSGPYPEGRKPFTPNEATRNMVEYKKRCVSEHFEDDSHFLKDMTFKEFVERMHDDELSVAVQMRKGLGEGDPEWEFAKRVSHGALQVNFGKMKLYVRDK